MKKILVIALVAIGGYKAWQTFVPTFVELVPSFEQLAPFSEKAEVPPLYEKPYVIVYGRDTCGLTRALRGELVAQNVPHVYKVIDEPSVMNELYPRMTRSGLDIRSFLLPVVDVNARLFISPSSSSVLQEVDIR